MADEQEKENGGEAAPSGDPSDVGASQAEAPAEPETLEAAKALLQEEKEKAQRLLANWQRAEADFVNYKRRVEQERAEAGRLANAALIINVLPVLDDLERALEAMPPRVAKSEWGEGIKLVERKFQTILQGMGVIPMISVGDAFDPNIHEALRQDSGPEGIIIAEFQKGYLMGEKVLRPARVVVGNGEEAVKEVSTNG